jgi:hypothetical protein
MVEVFCWHTVRYKCNEMWVLVRKARDEEAVCSDEASG